MATTTQKRPSPKVCFSFAAYAKSVISTLKISDVHVTTGLTDHEISTVETTAGFTFPPDLRSILSEGLPVGPGFPNWRSSSAHQLRLLSSLPLLSLSKAHGPTLDLGRAPPLVPVYKHCYIPSKPDMAGNPVFYVNGGDVRLLSVDVGGFFMDTDFWKKDMLFRRLNSNNNNNGDYNWVWGGVARRVEFWSDVAERGATRLKWWSGEMEGCLEEVMWRLRDGGWGEEDVREMMMIDGGDEAVNGTRGRRRVVRDLEGVVRHVRGLSRDLLRGGWSLDDVVYSLGDKGIVEVNGDEIISGILDGESWVDFQCPMGNNNRVELLMGR